MILSPIGLLLSSCSQDEAGNLEQTAGREATSTVTEHGTTGNEAVTVDSERPEDKRGHDLKGVAQSNSKATEHASRAGHSESRGDQHDSRPAPPQSHYITGLPQLYQERNNCSAAATSIALSRWDIDRSQQELRPRIRPDERAKRGPPERIVRVLQDEGLRAHIQHGGTVELVQALVAEGIPVIVQQLIDAHDERIGHYRVVRGYDRESGRLYAADPLRGDDIHLTTEEFYEVWRPFSNRYIPVYRPEQQDTVASLLGADHDFKANRERTADRLRERLSRDRSAAHLWFALGLNLYDLGRYRDAVEAYEQARQYGLSLSVIRYAPWIAAAYNNAGQPQAAYEVADALLTDNPVSGHLLWERARAAEALGYTDRARSDYQQAREYDPLLESD